MPQAFSCPNCSAALDYDGTQLVVRCAHCGSTVVVPESMRPRAAEPDPLVPDPSLSEVAALFRAGKRVQATIRYREITGAGLGEAKLAIDRFAAGEPLRRPNLLERY
jgi:DNA-directed RNA polymerase subunit RPC12/RpoP